MLANAWQYAPPVDPVGSDGGISDPLRFVPPAAAEEAYLVTELGNVFPVEDGSKNANTIIIQDSDNATKRDLAAINLFLMSSNAKIGGISNTDNVEYVIGSNSRGYTHPYHVYFKIPSNVANHTDGYVVTLRDPGDPSVSIPIQKFFSEYVYNDNTETLHATSGRSLVPLFESVAITNPYRSVLTSGTITNTNYGFEAVNPGTYVIKLHPGMVYWTNDMFDCFGNDCDKASAISTSADLMQTTSSGLSIPKTSSLNDRPPVLIPYSNSVNQAYSFDSTITYDTGGTQISSSGNIVTHNSNGRHGATFYVYCFGSVVNLHSGFKNGYLSFNYAGPYATSTRTVDGVSFLDNVNFRTDIILDPDIHETYAEKRESRYNCYPLSTSSHRIPYLTARAWKRGFDI